MKNPVFLLIVFVLAIATAYAISQEPASQHQTPQYPARQNTDQQVGPASGVGDPLAVAPAPQVQSEIQSAIGRQPGLNGKTIQVKVDDDTIELSGTVERGKDKVTIYRLAE